MFLEREAGTEFVMITPARIEDLIKSAVSHALREFPWEKETSKPDRCHLEEAVEITGLSKSKIYKLTAFGEIPHKHFGGKLVFSRKDLDRWVEENTKPKREPYTDAIQHLAEVAGKKKGATN
jgi:excisionase family DNA binding protein